MERWEYKIISSKELMAHKELEEQLNKFGEEGWEAVGVSHSFWKMGTGAICILFEEEKGLYWIHLIF